MESQVKVTQEVSDGLLVSLRETDQKFATINSKEFRGALEKYIASTWGSPSCKAFTGANGAPMWVTEITDSLGGIVYYAVITAGSSGGRTVAGFVDEDGIKDVVKSDEPKVEPASEVDPTATMTNSAKVEELDYELQKRNRDNALLENEIEALHGQLAILQSQPKDPVLVRYLVVGETEGQGKGDRIPIVSTHEAVGKVIGELLEKGVKANDIEIWGRKSVPKVKIEW